MVLKQKIPIKITTGKYNFQTFLFIKLSEDLTKMQIPDPTSRYSQQVWVIGLGGAGGAIFIFFKSSPGDSDTSGLSTF